VIETILTPAARRHIGELRRTIRGSAVRLERRFAAHLKNRGHGPETISALVAITPAAAAQRRRISDFLQQVSYYGQRLAKLNIAPGEAGAALAEFGALLDPICDGRFGPAREQLHLATILTLNDAFHWVREAETQAFFGLARAEAEASDFDDLLRRLVRVLTRAFQARAGRILFVDESAPSLSARGAGSEWRYPLGRGVLLQLDFAERSSWLPREQALLEAAAERCSAAIERARLERENRRLHAEMRHAEEEERRRIGRELHDESGQSLLLLRLQLDMIARHAPEGLQKDLGEAREIADRTIGELRRIIAALSPAVLERLGLERALRHLAGRFRKLHPATVRVRISGSHKDLARPIQEVIYRVAQESLQNIAKHSGAIHVKLSLHCTDKSVRLSVSDDGAGFKTEAAGGKPMSFGLAGMRERASLLGGSLVIRSAPGKGAKVALTLPRNSAVVKANGQNTNTFN
jgi:signal transduction histidine kinase